MSTTESPKALKGLGNFVDDRFKIAWEKNLRKVFPNHWSFMLGEIALYSFIILILTGVFLSLWFKPSMQEIIYEGSYARLNGVEMSEAYASTLHIMFEVRGGNLIRQIHHWAALIFLGSIAAHMLRIFFTGAFRRPREINWVIGVLIFVISILEGLFGYSLPDDLPSGHGVRILQGVMMSVPLVGPHLSFFLFGGEFPGEDIISRLYLLHILVLPGILLALITAHFMILWHQKHTQWPGPGRSDKTVVGSPMYPAFAVKAGAFFFFTFAVIAGLSALVQINPIHLFGPFTPTSVTSGLQPDWYMGFLEGALRIFPDWFDIWIAGYVIPTGVLFPAVVIFGALFTALGVWPWVERWITGDRRVHNVLDRPRNAPARTGLGVAGMTFYGLLWAAGANDVIAETFSISLYWTTYFFRVAAIIGPVIAFIITKRICLGLQRRDRATLEHGYESGVVRQLPSGEFLEVHRPISEETQDSISAKEDLVPASSQETDENGVVDPRRRTMKGRLQIRLNHWFTKDNVSMADVEPHAHDEGPEEVHDEVRSGR
ncbi:cytochrome bc complex cytochrome b subunit [Spiractinospora alimapuensis]|uniref:cytochrome bc1 complex cytochrome b subunit n=1 Tax=Spiractinospora alimapuensis TaxID=2820884 RepID=UPI001F32DA91|nr:cytochrome bc complex cytochrome b subunit [Spiractinospora alimapuensis]QVQ53239.1 cytochrome bc complex cytochrome b subunit [Spiractinospora alimapuensis]